MKRIKFKQILEEAAWDRTVGKALPTLNDVQKAYKAKKRLQELDKKPLQELDKRALGIVDTKDLKAFAKAIEGIAREMADDGYDEGDVVSFCVMFAEIKAHISYKKAVK